MEAEWRKPPGVRHRRIPIQFNVERACPEPPGRLRDYATATGPLARLRLEPPGRLRDSATVTGPLARLRYSHRVACATPLQLLNCRFSCMEPLSW